MWPLQPRGPLSISGPILMLQFISGDVPHGRLHVHGRRRPARSSSIICLGILYGFARAPLQRTFHLPQSSSRAVEGHLGLEGASLLPPHHTQPQQPEPAFSSGQADLGDLGARVHPEEHRERERCMSFCRRDCRRPAGSGVGSGCSACVAKFSMMASWSGRALSLISLRPRRSSSRAVKADPAEAQIK